MIYEEKNKTASLLFRCLKQFHINTLYSRKLLSVSSALKQNYRSKNKSHQYLSWSIEETANQNILTPGIAKEVSAYKCRWDLRWVLHKANWIKRYDVELI